MNKVAEYDTRFSDLQQVMNALDWARKQDLDLEWLESFLCSYVQDQDAVSALHYANREWDL